MPKLVNRNSHAIRTTDSEGAKHRLRSGQVVDAAGAQADALMAVSGVSTATKDDEKAWDAARGLKGTGNSRSSIVSVTGILTKARVAGRIASVVVPLNEVIGDDNAPLGPPSGTITTKQAVARNSELENQKFGQRERMPEDADNEKLNEVERQQAANVAVLEELHDEVIAESQGEPADEPEPDEPDEKPADKK